MKLKPYFTRVKSQTRTNHIVSRRITCCTCSEFDVLYYGDIKKSIFGRVELYDDKNGMAVILRCKKCGQEIELFNSLTDGYDRCIEQKTNNIDFDLKFFSCKEDAPTFSVLVSLEYPPKQELIDTGITDCENAFSLIWISLKCNSCNRVFKNLVNYETG